MTTSADTSMCCLQARRYLTPQRICSLVSFKGQAIEVDVSEAALVAYGLRLGTKEIHTRSC